MHSTRSGDSLKLNANTLTCFLRALGGPQSSGLTDGTDMGLGEDACMGTLRCEFQTLSQAVGIPVDPCSKGPQQWKEEEEEQTEEEVVGQQQEQEQ